MAPSSRPAAEVSATARSRCARALPLLVLAAFLWNAAGAAPVQATREQQIKAAFIYNFTKFVEWPAARFVSDSAPIVIGILEQTPLTAELDTAVLDRRVNGRSIVLKRVASADEVRTVHLLFVGEQQEGQYAALARGLQESAVLTVGESRVFAEAGGIINFVIDGDKVRFEINMKSAELAHLKLSAQLQKLATVIRRSP